MSSVFVPWVLLFSYSSFYSSVYCSPATQLYSFHSTASQMTNGHEVDFHEKWQLSVPGPTWKHGGGGGI